MPEIDPVILQLRAELKEYKAELRATTTLVDRSLGRQERAVTSLEQRFERASRGIGGSLGRLGGALTALISIGAARELLGLVDGFKQIEAQLRLATKEFGSFTQAQGDAQAIASNTRSGLAETTKLYSSLVRVAADTGKTQSEAARATETFSKALKVGGANAAETASATLQFSQALASGVLNGDELRAILEASPRLAKLFADSLGVTVGQLRKLGEDGDITSDKLFRALSDRKFTASIDEEFKSLPVTFDQAMTSVLNAATLTFGAFDRGGDFSTALATFVSDGSDGFKSLTQSAEQAGIDIRATFEGLGDAFEPLLAGAKAVFSQIGFDSRSITEQIRGDFSLILGLLDRIGNIDVGSERLVRGGANALVRGGVLDQRFYTAPKDMPSYYDMQGRFNRGFDQSRATSRARINDQDRKDFFQDLWRNGAGVLPRASSPRPAIASSGAKPSKAKGASADTLARRAAAARLREERDDQMFARERADADLAILRAKNALASAADSVLQYELQEIETSRARQEDAYRSLVAQKRLSEAEAGVLIAKNNELADLKREEAQRADRERNIQRQQANADLQVDALRAEAELVTTRSQRLEIERRILDLQQQEERARLDAAIAAGQIADATQARADLARKQSAERAGLERGGESPGQRFARDIRELDINDELENIQVDALRRLNDELTKGIKNALGLKGALGDVVGQLIQIGIQRQIIGPLADALFGAAGVPGGGVFGSIFGSLFGRASGGFVQGGRAYRVNEGASPGRVEGFRPLGSGTIIPLGQMEAARRGGGTTVVQHFSLQAPNSILASELVDFIERRSREAAQAGAQGGYTLAQRDLASITRTRL